MNVRCDPFGEFGGRQLFTAMCSILSGPLQRAMSDMRAEIMSVNVKTFVFNRSCRDLVIQYKSFAKVPSSEDLVSAMLPGVKSLFETEFVEITSADVRNVDIGSGWKELRLSVKAECF